MTTVTTSHPHYGARISAAISALLFFLILGTTVFHRLEGWNWTKSFYFTVTTLATVGYGDLHPTTDASRLFTSLFILIGVGVTVTALGVIGAAYLEQRTERIVERQHTE